MIPTAEKPNHDDGQQGGGVGRRMRLREFQTRLVGRMQAAQSGTDSHPNHLGVVIGSKRWLISLRHAGEIVPAGSITPVPLTPDWFLGVTSIRGTLASVADLARFHGAPRWQIDKDSRVRAFSPTLAFNGALLVTRVLGLRNMTQMRETDAPGDSQPSPWASAHYVDDDGQDWTRLDLSLVIQDPRFLHVGI